jgi:hypothetical protein
MADETKVLLISPRFAGQSYFSLEAVCEISGGRTMTSSIATQKI